MDQSLRGEGITRGLLLDHLISECGCTVKRSKVSNAFTTKALYPLWWQLQSKSNLLLHSLEQNRNKKIEVCNKIIFQCVLDSRKKKPSYVLLTHSFTHSLY